MAVKATYQPGGDQDPPGDTWRHPKPPKKILLIKIIYGLRFLLLTNFDLALPSRGYSTDLSRFTCWRYMLEVAFV